MKYFFAALISLLIGAIIVHYAVGEDSFKYSGKLQSNKIMIKAPNLLLPKFDPYYPGKPINSKKQEIKRAPIKVIGEVSAIYVQSGDKVKKGQELLTIKNQLFDDQLIMNQAAVDELVANNDELENNKQKIYDEKNKLYSVQSDLENKLNELKSSKEKLKKKLVDLEKLKKQLSKIPKSPTAPGAPINIQQTKKQVTATGQTPSTPDINKINSGISQLNNALSKINKGLSQINSALNKIPGARSKLSTASGELNDIQILMGFQKKALSATVNFSKNAKGYLTLRSPKSGTVSSINVTIGDTICANQSLINITASNKMKVIIPLPINDSENVKKNKKTFLRVDGIKQIFKGKITFISSKINLAPTTAITKDVHLIRTENIEIETTNIDGILKDGMPVDVKIL